MRVVYVAPAVVCMRVAKTVGYKAEVAESAALILQCCARAHLARAEVVMVQSAIVLQRHVRKKIAFRLRHEKAVKRIEGGQEAQRSKRKIAENLSDQALKRNFHKRFDQWWIDREAAEKRERLALRRLVSVDSLGNNRTEEDEQDELDRKMQAELEHNQLKAQKQVRSWTWRIDRKTNLGGRSTAIAPC